MPNTVIITRQLRPLVRAAVVSHPHWHAWRATNPAPDGTLWNVSSIPTAALRRAAQAMGIDIEALARANGLTPAYFDDGTVSGPATATYAAAAPHLPEAARVAIADHASDTFDTDPDTHTQEPATMTTATATATAMPTKLEGAAPSDLINAALAPVSDYVSSKVLAALTDAVRPLAEAAAQGPRVETREVIKEVIKTVAVRAPGGDTADAGTGGRLCQITGRDTAVKALGLKLGETGAWRAPLLEDVSLWDGASDDGVPAVDPFHVWDAEAAAYMAIASRHADAGHRLRNMSRVLFFGPAGVGKTSTAIQYAARTGRPFFRIAFDRTTEGAELTGQRMPKAGGGTEYREGALVSAMQVPGAVILLDEPSFLRPGVAAVLQTILDNGCCYLKEDGNRRVDLAPGVIIVAADNTNLTGDETGRYADTMVQNIALQDRFAFIVQMDYLPPNREADLLVNITGIPVDAARVMVGFAGATRKGAATGQVTSGCSLRRLVAWSLACREGVPSAAAFKASIMNGADAADRETLRGLEKNLADHGMIDRTLRPAAPDTMSGTGATPGSTLTSEGAQAASVFASSPVAS